MKQDAAVWVVGTWDTKAEELAYMADILRTRGVRVLTVDVGTRSECRSVDLQAQQVLQLHPSGAPPSIGQDRGESVIAMSQALCAAVASAVKSRAVAGILAAGGSGGTSLIAPAMRLLPIGVPKLMISTMASGDVGPYVDVTDMAMMYPVTDIAGLNRLSRTILGNAAHAMAGMILGQIEPVTDPRPPVACSMFGVTTPCVQRLRDLLKDSVDLQVFHANGPGGRAMEALAASGMVQGIVDLTTTEVVQNVVGSVCDAGPGRLAAVAEHGLPWIGSLGALDMVNWGPPDTIPERFRARRFHVHNANVTLMRTNAAELAEAGRRIAQKLNEAPGLVRLLIPAGGLSALDAPGQPFFDPDADLVLFQTLEQHFRPTDRHHLVKVPLHINNPEFAELVALHVRECIPGAV